MGETDVTHTADAERSPSWRRSIRKNRVWVPVAILGAAATAAAIVWWVWLPQYRPGLEVGEVFGVDVSNHQRDIDWERVSRDDIEFAYIKATEGGDFVDGWFAENWSEAQASGLDVGAYHFFTLCRRGAEQATNFLEVVPTREAALPPALDLEIPGNCAERPSVDWVHTEVSAWLDSVRRATGHEPLLYIGPRFDELYDITTVFSGPTWHRKILRRPGDDRWVVWQFSYFADVDGIEGGVDLNVMRPGA